MSSNPIGAKWASPKICSHNNHLLSFLAYAIWPFCLLGFIYLIKYNCDKKVVDLLALIGVIVYTSHFRRDFSETSRYPFFGSLVRVPAVWEQFSTHTCISQCNKGFFNIDFLITVCPPRLKVLYTLKYHFSICIYCSNKLFKTIQDCFQNSFPYRGN